jgi:diacylglycerol kinase family enzyme
MYYYILDPHNIPQKDFERKQAELQSLLTEFKVNGECPRVTPLRIISDLVETAANRGAKTLVACGTDETFNQILGCLKDQDLTLAFIPFMPNTQLGRILGMKDLQTAVKTIASRRIEKIDVARINGSYFISYLEIGVGVQTNKDSGIFSLIKLFNSQPITLKMRIDDSYNISSDIMGGLLVNTRGTETGGKISKVGNPQDGFLDLLMIEKLGKFAVARHKKEIIKGCYEKIPGSSLIRCKKVEFLEPNALRIYIDGKEVARMPSVVQVMPGKLKMIVGKSRTF